MKQKYNIIRKRSSLLLIGIISLLIAGCEINFYDENDSLKENEAIYLQAPGGSVQLAESIAEGHYRVTDPTNSNQAGAYVTDGVYSWVPKYSYEGDDPFTKNITITDDWGKPTIAPTDAAIKKIYIDDEETNNFILLDVYGEDGQKVDGRTHIYATSSSIAGFHDFNEVNGWLAGASTSTIYGRINYEESELFSATQLSDFVMLNDDQFEDGVVGFRVSNPSKLPYYELELYSGAKLPSNLIDKVDVFLTPLWLEDASIVSSNVTHAGATITWPLISTIAGVTPEGYDIYQDGEWVQTVAANVTQYDVTGLTADTTYQFEVAPKYNGKVGDDRLRTQITASSAPLTIDSPPSNQTVVIGETATFTVAAQGAAPISYQWQVERDSEFVDMDGETTATLTLNEVALSMNGNKYRVVVTNDKGSITSDSAMLTVNPRTSPSLTPDHVDNDTVNAIEVTFNDDAAWRGAITALNNGETTLQEADYSITEGKIVINAGVLSAGTHTLTVVAVGYADVSVIQSVNLQDRPANPQNLIAIAGDRMVTLNWDTVSSATYYNVYMSEVPNVFDETALVTVTEATYQVPDLTNGTSYYFVVLAGNSGGLSAHSIEVSVTPATVPAAPTNVTAIAGNGSATINFTPPADNGGSPIVGYEVFDSSGNLVATGSAEATSITITELTNSTTYTFTIKAKNAAGYSDSSTQSNAVTPKYPTTNDGHTGGLPTTTEQVNTGIVIHVNGKDENIGTVTTNTVNAQQVTTISLDEDKLQKHLDAEGKQAVIKIMASSNSEVLVGELSGRTVKSLENQQAMVEISTGSGAYRLPAAQINIDAISKRFGLDLALQDIKVKIEIAQPQTENIRVVEDAANREGLTIVAPPINFKVSAVYGERTEEVTVFNSYVERRIAIPEGVDPKRITTAVVVDPDGTVRQVPTKVVEINGIYYALINSLTNSTYAVVWNPIEFKDMENHWAKDVVNNMGSRMILAGTGKETFSPNRDITRAEFASIIVKGLGLKPKHDQSSFTDVNQEDWFSNAVQTAYDYGLINGYADGTFRPNDKITREQAMHIIANALKVTGLAEKLNNLPIEADLQAYGDAVDVSSWAVNSISASIQAGIVSGRSNNMIAPKAFISRAEVAALVERLLKQSELI